MRNHESKRQPKYSSDLVTLTEREDSWPGTGLIRKALLRIETGTRLPTMSEPAHPGSKP